MGNTSIKTKGQNCCRLSRTLGRIVDQAPLRSTNIKTITATSLSNSTKRKINLFNRIHLPIKLVSNTKFRTRCTKTRNKNSSVQCGNLTQLISQGFNDRIGSKPTQNLCGIKTNATDSKHVCDHRFAVKGMLKKEVDCKIVLIEKEMLLS